MKNQLFAFLICIISITCVNSQTRDSLIKVTDGVYIITGHVCNISIVVTSNGVLVVDAGNDTSAGVRIKEYVSSITNQPIKNVVLTHYHWDHSTGLVSLPTNIPIYAQTNTKTDLINRQTETARELKTLLKTVDSLKNIKTDSLYFAKLNRLNELKNTKYVFPNQLVDNEKQIVMGNDTIMLIYPGKAHTNGDLVVWLKTRNIMIMGDLLFTHSNPYIDPLGNAENWANELRKFALLKLPYYIPGHLKVANANDLVLLANYLDDLRSAVLELKKQGKTLEEIKNLVKLPAYDDFEFMFFRKENIEAVYGQLE
jgi:glyoxylase-like metal-dependent hydrolase (beta-lactamase superfamily II)